MDSGIFTLADRALLEKIGVLSTVQAGGMIYFEGEAADKIYYICKGRVRVFQNMRSGREVTLDVVEAGHIIGESAFVEGNVRPTSIQAVNTVQVISCRVTDLLPYFAQDPQLALHFLQQCSKTMDRLARRLNEQCLLDRYGKVASFILDLTAVDSPEKGTVGGVLPYTHENLAEALGLSRSTVSMVLKLFADKGWVENGYREVRVIDRKALSEYIASKNAG